MFNYHFNGSLQYNQLRSYISQSTKVQYLSKDHMPAVTVIVKNNHAFEQPAMDDRLSMLLSDRYLICGDM